MMTTQGAIMGSELFFVQGRPATFATKGEAPWKEFLAARIPRPSLDGGEKGIVLDFRLPSLAPMGRPLDVDNLCEPVFSVLINKTGWFGGSRTNLLWWDATKQENKETGCRVEIHTGVRRAIPKASPMWQIVYDGPMPKHAKSIELAQWAWDLRHEAHSSLIPESCTVHLVFGGDQVNLGAISAGGIKAFIDCLYPLIGGTQGAPDDHRISRLIVEKNSADLKAGQVGVKIWTNGTRNQPLPELPNAKHASIPTKNRQSESKPAEGSRRAITNPCREGTRKAVVCDSALKGLSVKSTRAELEKLAVGAGCRLSEYIADLRSENGLDIQIIGAKLICVGRL